MQESTIDLTISNSTANHLLQLVQRKAPLDKADEDVTFDETKDYLLSNPLINTNQDKFIDSKDNIVYLKLMLLADIKLKNPRESKYIEEIGERLTKRINEAKHHVAKIVADIDKTSEFPEIKDREITKAEVRKMISIIHEKAKKEAKEDPAKKDFFNVINTYLKYFDSTNEDELWINRGGTTPCLAGFHKDKEGKVRLYTGLDRELARQIWNYFPDKDVQTILTVLIYKEGSHLRDFENNFDHQLNRINIAVDFESHFQSALSDDKKSITLTNEVVESARWFVGLRLHEEFKGYKAMYDILLGNNYNKDKFEEVVSLFGNIPKLGRVSQVLKKDISENIDETGKLDEVKFEKDFIDILFSSAEEEYKKEKENDEQRLEREEKYFFFAVNIIKLAHKSLEEDGTIDKGIPYTVFLERGEYCDVSKYPEELKVKKE